MTDREFFLEFKRGLAIILRAFMRRYGVTWLDFLPREVAEDFVCITNTPVVTADTARPMGTGV